MVVLLSEAQSSTVVAAEYAIRKLDPAAPGIYNYSSAVAINNNGVVLGSGSAMYTTDLITVWLPGQTIGTNIYYFGYNRTSPEGINDNGDIVGYGPDNNSQPHGRFNSVDLGIGYTNAVNNLGQVAGWTFDSLYIWKDGVFDYQPTAYWGSEILSINDSGVATGYWYTDCSSDCIGELCIFRNDSVIFLGRPAGLEAQGNDINNGGKIAGWSCMDDNCTTWQGFIWDQGNWTMIPTLGGRGSAGEAINSNGVVVGTAYNTANAQRAFVFDTQRGIRDLNTLVPPGSGWELLTASDINDAGQIVGVGRIGGLTRAFILSPPRHLIVRGLNGDSIPNRTFTVSRVRNNKPAFTEELTITVQSDSLGKITLDSTQFPTGDSIKVSLAVTSVPAVKHPTILGSKCTITLDNGWFDENSVFAYDELNDSPLQYVVLGHTTVAYNLLVSVEWDAELGYLSDLELSFERMANYLYDVSDGQMRLDTVRIYDNKMFWGDADVRISASTQVWPHVLGLNGIDRSGLLGAPIMMPRRFFGSKDANRNGAWTENPLQVSAVNMYRTLAHEFGHYAPGFGDEYVFGFFSGGRCAARTPDDSRYGFMDCQYENCEPYASEMSSDAQYADAACQNNNHWSTYDMSCWGRFEQLFEGLYGADSVQVPIIRPEERFVPPGLDYLPGPNDNLGNLDYSVGHRVVFPVIQSLPSAYSIEIGCYNSGVPAPKVDVYIIKSLFNDIQQGQTADNGKMRVLGYAAGNTIVAFAQFQVESGLATGAPARQWAFGQGATSSDTMRIDLQPITGEYPLVFVPTRLDGGWQLQLYAPNVFQQTPGCAHLRESAVFRYRPVDQTANGYAVSADTVGTFGTFTFEMTDAVYQDFVVPIPYVQLVVPPGSPASKAVSDDGGMELMLEGAPAVVPCSVMVVTSPYPIIRSGLAEQSIQAGRTYGIGASSLEPFTKDPLMTIRYADTDVPGPDVEMSLRVFKWDEVAAQWQLIGGAVDTAKNEVSCAITSLGSYAAFTTSSPTGVDDQNNGRLPSNYGLEQNYPNPFNPSTTIAFDLPVRSTVRLDIVNLLGQQVRRLADGEREAGSHRVVWDGRDQSGRPVASGVYLYRLSAGNQELTRKMILIR